jgi:prephenate dehydrogenase
MALFERVAVLGLGLLGGSIALALRERGLAKEVVGVSRDASTLAAARDRGAIDRGSVVPEEGVAGAELVILACPVEAMPGLLERAAPGLCPGALVHGVGSVKGGLAETLPGRLPPGVEYLGSHPMAGSHLRGLQHARADLLEAAACVITPRRETTEAALERLRALWSALGMRIEERDPQRHDLEVAWISHGPHAVAFAFAAALDAAPDASARLRGGGFRDFARIARSDAALWSEILAENPQPTAAVLARVAEELSSLAEALQRGDREALRAQIERGRAAVERGD